MRRCAAPLPIALLILSSGCGYIGPIVPPSPKIPMAVNDLAVIERGDQLEITFTPPNRTTDQAVIDKFRNFDLQISSQHYDVPVSLKPVDFKVAAADWVGKDIAVSVRTAIKEDRDSGPSNVVTMKVLAPLATPVVSEKPAAQGYVLSWPDDGPGVQYEIWRKGPTDNKFLQIGTSTVATYTDGSVPFEMPYVYEVQAHAPMAESLMSQPLLANEKDEFPPGPPAGLAGVATPDAVELSWSRNTESDLKGYYVYRAGEDGNFTKISDLLVVPSFTDPKVEHGKTYQYEVRAIDQTNNLGDPSAQVSVTFP